MRLTFYGMLLGGLCLFFARSAAAQPSATATVLVGPRDGKAPMLWRRTQPPWGDGSWVPVCTAPCRAEVDANAGLLLHIAGIAFEELQMEGPGPHRVTMRPGSRAEKDCGFGLTLTGGIAFTFGGVAWWTARFVDASAATRTGYAITTVTGLAALVTGIALLVDRRKFAEVRSPTQGSGWLRIATGESPSEGHLPCRAVAAQRARWQRNA